jgi:hypothetical protein
MPDYHRNWEEEVLKRASNRRDEKWTQSIAVGDKEYVLQTKAKLGARGIGRKAFEDNMDYVLKEAQNLYNPVLPLKRVL